MQYVEYVSNQLGWSPETPAALPMHRRMIIWASRVKKKVADNPSFYSWNNLVLAVEYMRRQHLEIRTPLAPFAYIPSALKVAADTTTSAMSDLIDQAIEYELSHQLPGWESWRDRLARAFGGYRQQAYQEWQQARGVA